ncbi:DUF6950 family protein [Brevundimonas sp. GCM10030266]|uniref:DUF6950 family protein n=1 Tax=Brevundimonas sp. GCM10030266 TaxID=3273386 RepID=UPI0036061C84
MTDLLKRAAATQACMDRFAFKPLTPEVHCARPAAMAMHRMGRSAKLLNGCKGKSWPAVLKYVRGLGFKDLVELMDATGLKRIAPAAALPGDIIALPVGEDDAFGCSLAVALDNGRVLAANAATGLIEPMVPHLFVCAWRV